jgi:cell division septation protein DedD
MAVIGLTACDENGEFSLATPQSADGDAEVVVETPTGDVIERDVEAPEVFDASEAGLWDGRPSLGGVWVAHPEVTEPERVMIRNASNGKEVVGALFRRERDNPGPRIQVSSDAADSLGMLAGQPVQLDVVALRREEIPVAPPVDDATVASADPGDISEQSLDPIEAAAAAIDEAEQGATAATTATAAAAASTAATAEPAATPAPAPASSLDKPFVQIGIFSVEANANNTAASLRNIGIVPTIRRQESQGKEFWRVIVGPATTSQERAQILRQVKDLGFADAYFVKS